LFKFLFHGKNRRKAGYLFGRAGSGLIFYRTSIVLSNAIPCAPFIAHDTLSGDSCEVVPIHQNTYVLKSNHRCFANRCLSLPEKVGIGCRIDAYLFAATL